MTSTSDRLIDFLEEHSTEFLHNWRDKIVISEEDLYKTEVLRNGLRMYELVKRAIRNPLSEEEIRMLAYKTAQERVEANVNISEFVYNVNVGKSEIIKWVSRSGIEWDALQRYLEEINSLFDRFSYLAVKQYTDIRDKQLQEKELYIDQTHKERLTILGQMSSSFVHEFRNPLTSIIGFTKLLQHDHPDLPYLDIMQHELDQLNYRISQFLHVSRKEIIESKRETINLADMFDDLVEFLYPSLLDGDVTVKVDIDRDLNVSGNKDELRQVFLNLVMNSIDALQQVPGERELKIHSTVKEGMLHLSIINNGPQIEEGTINAIFEPFYTTKELGTGIGLFICKKLIEKHGGEIMCRSTEDETSFTIGLPLWSEVTFVKEKI
ncbi:HAMP domain-containing histidine kinase [Rossellomorea aquimaris]|uniref:sensor histidine kinase n=1 Tax=Rossellomorea aquimaris TaxID=189382 RepID=UPI001CD563DE|nr:HAMP domain-containing sensor histidine kinase [Rossellomorea aquimaris]MCA1055240.1 HAMP domain-containing histidine kinase [Rossellomorea aquimaris]